MAEQATALYSSINPFVLRVWLKLADLSTLQQCDASHLHGYFKVRIMSWLMAAWPRGQGSNRCRRLWACVVKCSCEVNTSVRWGGAKWTLSYAFVLPTFLVKWSLFVTGVSLPLQPLQALYSTVVFTWPMEVFSCDVIDHESLKCQTWRKPN